MDDVEQMEPSLNDTAGGATGQRDSLLQRIDTALKNANQKIASFGVVIMLAIGILNLVDIIVFRWLLNAPITGSNELFSTLFSVAIASVLASGLSQRANLEVDLLSGVLSERQQSVLRAIGAFLYLFLIVCLAVAVFDQLVLSYERGMETPIRQWKLWPFYTVIFILFLLCIPAQAVAALDLAGRVGRPVRSTLVIGGGTLLALAAVVAAISLPRPAFQSDMLTASVIVIVLVWGALLFYVPLAAVLGGVAMLGITATFGPNAAFNIAGSETLGLLRSSDLGVIPYFLLMGGFAIAGGMSNDIYRFAHALFAPFRGGLALATIGGCAGFGALTGSSMATIISIGTAAYPEMTSRGYARPLVSGVIAAGGTLGQLIPPSTVVVIYALLVEESIGAMYLAILVPAVITVICYAAVVLIWVAANKNAAPSGGRWDRRELRESAAVCLPVFLMFATVMGSIFFGVMTATEAASLGAVFAFVVALWRRKLSNGAFWSIAAAATRSTSMIYFMIIGALIITFFLASTSLLLTITDGVVGLGLPTWAVLSLMVAFYILIGAFMDSTTVMMITASTSAAIVQALGFDLLWWGVIMVLLVELGVLTPPFGINIFILKSIAPDLSVGTAYRGVIPFVLIDLLKIVFLIAFPALVLWIPGIN